MTYQEDKFDPTLTILIGVTVFAGIGLIALVYVGLSHESKAAEFCQNKGMEHQIIGSIGTRRNFCVTKDGRFIRVYNAVVGGKRIYSTEQEFQDGK